MKKFISILKKIGDVLLFCVGVRGTETEKEAIENDLVSREGQGATSTGIKTGVYYENNNKSK